MAVNGLSPKPCLLPAFGKHKIWPLKHSGLSGQLHTTINRFNPCQKEVAPILCPRLCCGIHPYVFELSSRSSPKPLSQ